MEGAGSVGVPTSGQSSAIATLEGIPRRRQLRSVELFAGAGGLAIGVSEAGFCHDVVLEWDQWACDTIRENQRRAIDPVVGWRLIQADVRHFDYTRLSSGVDLLSGGPPCQPFSLGGKHRGHSDHRDMFPEVVRATCDLAPRAVLIENVRGLLRRSFARYFEYIILRLTYPELIRKPSEDWLQHLSRLEQHHTSGSNSGLSYRVVFRVLNAADYGVPQRRERVFIVGFRSDLGLDWAFPAPTHSEDSLIWDQFITGEYWERHGMDANKRGKLTARTSIKADRLRGSLFSPPLKPWLTVRDAISDLPDPISEVASSKVLNHRYNPGARPYPGHTGSPLDEPAKTLKAGDHGVPGGENMLALPDGRVRYFTVRESARLQTFPDDYAFHGSWTETMRQLGNAVPVILARTVASAMAERLCEVATKDIAL